MLTSKYIRPSKLSDPYYDNNSTTLKNILRKRDEELNWSDYSILFGPHFPGGTYDELMYFLPGAFNYLKEHNNDALDLVTPIFGFCSNNVENFRNDGLLDVISQYIHECLNLWSNKFEIVHFDEKACLEKEWALTHKDCVKDSEVLLEGTTDLVRFKSLKYIAVSFYESLSSFDGNQIKASWFLELSRSRFDVYTPPNCKKINKLLSNKKLLNQAYDLIYPMTLDYSMSPTYWKNTLNQLSL